MVLTISSLLVSIVAASTFTYFIFYLRKIHLYRETARLPGPLSWPLLGSAHHFMGDTDEFLNKTIQFFSAYSSPSVIWIAYKLVYGIYDPDQIKIVLTSPNTLEKGEVYRFIRPWLGDGLLNAPTQIWKVHRKLINPTFNTRILESSVKVFAAKSEIMVKQMEVELNKGEFNLFSYIFLCTLDFISESAMGLTLNAQIQKDLPYVKSTKCLLEIINIRMFKIWLYPDFIFNRTQLGRKQREHVKCVHDFTNNVIKTRKQAFINTGNHQNKNGNSNTQETRKVFIDQLLELSDEGVKLTDKELRDEVETMMIAGSDTTATMNSFAILMMASYPEIQEKVYEELYGIYGSEDPSCMPVKHEDLPRMEYLERVIKETMRLFPAGPVMPRCVTKDLDIGKCTLRKGSTAVVATIITHRSPEYWKDPMTFNPDRFLPEENAKRHPYAYIPFSAGPRNCIGLKYAMMAMKSLLSTLLRKYVFIKDNVLPIEDIKVKADVIIKPILPITVRIERRSRVKDCVN